MPLAPIPWNSGSPCWIDAQVPDVAAAAEFYREIFGWDIAVGGAETGGYAMCSIGGKAVAGIGPQPAGATLPDGSPMPGIWTSYLASDDAAATHRKVLAAGGTALMEPFDVLGFGRMFVAMDPAGASFGVWQPLAHHGYELLGEPGSMCWFETHTRDYAAAQRFYAEVFGYRFTEIGDGEGFVYSTFAVPDAGEGEASGGIMDVSQMPESPSYWLAWIATADTDATVAAVRTRGGETMMGPVDSPYGRMAVLRAPQGEIFGVIDMSTATVEPAG